MQKLPPTATLIDIVTTHHSPGHFIANVRHLMSKAESERGPSVVKIGIMGAGKLPNFRIDAADGSWSLGAFDGVSFKPFETGSDETTWSSNSMDFRDVDALLKKLRNYTK